MRRELLGAAKHSHSSNGDSGTGTLGKGRHRLCGWAGWSDVVHSHIDLKIKNQGSSSWELAK